VKRHRRRNFFPGDGRERRRADEAARLLSRPDYTLLDFGKIGDGLREVIEKGITPMAAAFDRLMVDLGKFYAPWLPAFGSAIASCVQAEKARDGAAVGGVALAAEQGPEGAGLPEHGVGRTSPGCSDVREQVGDRLVRLYPSGKP
jgi:hypothetical protein